ncbi:MAG: hypothetical protein ACREXU_04450 [Gammaproteobacteria bacterium]
MGQALGEIAGIARSAVLEAVAVLVTVAAMNGMWPCGSQLSGSLTDIEGLLSSVFHIAS